jgi:hypothetical protein
LRSLLNLTPAQIVAGFTRWLPPGPPPRRAPAARGAPFPWRDAALGAGSIALGQFAALACTFRLLRRMPGGRPRCARRTVERSVAHRPPWPSVAGGTAAAGRVHAVVAAPAAFGSGRAAL